MFFNIKRFFLFVFLFFTFAGCFENEEPGQRYPIEDYLPLKIGNWWEYVAVETNDTFLLEITKCDTFEGNLYYFISRENPLNGGFFFCFDGKIGYEPGILVISDDTGPDILLKEPIESGNKWSGDFFGFEDDTLIIEEIAPTTYVPAGSFENCIMVRWKNTDIPHLAYSVYGWDFAPGVGIIRWVRIEKEDEDFRDES